MAARQQRHLRLGDGSGATRLQPTATSGPVDRTRTSQRAAPTGVRPAGSSRTSSTTKMVDEILRRLQPHAIVQGYDKALRALQIEPRVVVNGENQPAVALPGAASLGTQWTASQDTKAAGRRIAVPSGPMGSFHYAWTRQYSPSQPELTLDTLQNLDVRLQSSTTSGARPCSWLAPTTALSRKSWRLVAETDRKIGLALYELPLGPWQSSSMLALVWAQRLEVVNLYLFVHVAEMLYNCPPREIRVLPDDVDASYGLHSLTVAVTIRDLQRVHWEQEFYGVAFAPVDSKAGTPPVVRAQLLDAAVRDVRYHAFGELMELMVLTTFGYEQGYRDRGRYTKAPPSLSIATDAITYAFTAALVVDVTVWEGACLPIWGFSRALSITRRPVERAAVDFSLAVSGESREALELTHRDLIRGNAAVVALEAPHASTGKPAFVRQITLELSLRFINDTFDTHY